MNIINQFVSVNRRITNFFILFCSNCLGELPNPEKSFYKVLSENKWRHVIEVGGANRPLFSVVDLERYIGIDIDQDFDWNNVYSEYYPQSCENSLPEHVKGDLVVSKYLLEHVRDNKKAFNNILRMIDGGGISVHLFPLGYHPFSVANRLIGNKLAKRLIPILRPGSETLTGYPAYYHLCNSWQLENLLGRLKVKYHIYYYFGAEDYFAFFAPIGCCVHLLNRFASACKINILASNAVLVFRS